MSISRIQGKWEIYQLEIWHRFILKRLYYFSNEITLNVFEKLTTNSFTRQVVIFHKHHTRQSLAVVILWMMSLVDWKHFAENSRELSVPELQGYHAWSDSYVIAFRTRKPYTIIMGIIKLKKGVVNTGSMTPIFTQRNHDLFTIRILATFITWFLNFFLDQKLSNLIHAMI